MSCSGSCIVCIQNHDHKIILYTIWQNENMKIGMYLCMYWLIYLYLFERIWRMIWRTLRDRSIESKTKIETVHLRTTTSTTILHGTIGKIIHDIIRVVFYSSLYLIEKVWICCFIEYEISIRNSIFILFYLFYVHNTLIISLFLSFGPSLQLIILCHDSAQWTSTSTSLIKQWLVEETPR